MPDAPPSVGALPMRAALQGIVKLPVTERIAMIYFVHVSIMLADRPEEGAGTQPEMQR